MSRTTQRVNNNTWFAPTFLMWIRPSALRFTGAHVVVWTCAWNQHRSSPLRLHETCNKSLFSSWQTAMSNSWLLECECPDARQEGEKSLPQTNPSRTRCIQRFNRNRLKCGRTARKKTEANFTAQETNETKSISFVIVFRSMNATNNINRDGRRCGNACNAISTLLALLCFRFRMEFQYEKQDEFNWIACAHIARRRGRNFLLFPCDDVNTRVCLCVCVVL